MLLLSGEKTGESYTNLCFTCSHLPPALTCVRFVVSVFELSLLVLGLRVGLLRFHSALLVPYTSPYLKRGLPQRGASRRTGIIKGQQAGQKMGLVIMRTVRQVRGKR